MFFRKHYNKIFLLFVIIIAFFLLLHNIAFPMNTFAGDGDGDELGETEAETDELGESDGELLVDGLLLALGLTLAEGDWDALELPDGDIDADGDKLLDELPEGETEALGDCERLVDELGE